MEKQLQFPTHLLKNLVDRSQEKRDFACKELMDITQACVRQSATGKIRKFVAFFQTNFIRSNSLQYKKAGLKALCSIAAGLAHNKAAALEVSSDIFDAVMVGVEDNSDAKARFASIQALSSICRHLDAATLKFLRRIFQALVNKVCDCDDQVKGAALYFNNQIRTYVNENLPNNREQVAQLLDLISKNMVASNPVVKQFLLDWLSTVDQIPSVNIVLYTPHYLHQLLKLVGDKNPDTKRKAERLQARVREQFRQQLRGGKSKLQREDLSQVIKIAVQCTDLKGSSSYTILKATEWLNVLLECLLQVAEKDASQETCLKQAVLQHLPHIFESTLLLLSNDEQTIRAQASRGNRTLSLILQRVDQALDLSRVFPFVRQMLTQRHLNEANQSFGVWMKFLLQRPNEQNPQVELLMHRLMLKVVERQPNVVEVFLKLNFHQSYHQRIVLTLLRVAAQFIATKKKLDFEAIEPVLVKLCQCIGSQLTFKSISRSLRGFGSPNFLSQMLGLLTHFLVTSPLLEEVRLLLRSKDRMYFESVFQNWAMRASSAVTLCFMGQQFQLAFQILSCFEQQPVSQALQFQLYEVASLLQGPNFTFLRLKLLNAKENYFIVKALSALLMIVPQGRLFTLLKSRLQLVRQSEPVHSKQKDPLLSVFRELALK